MNPPISEDLRAPAKAGLSGDPVEFMALTEIGIISQLSNAAFTRLMPKGMTVAQFSVLNHLLRKQTAETVGELAIAMQVAQPTMSSTVRKLEEKGFVDLQADPGDGRIRRVQVTEAGKDMRNACVAALKPSRHILAQALSQQEWETLLHVLMKLRVEMDRARD